MNASEYKKRFLAFLTIAYPDGLPSDFTELVFSVGDLEFAFPIDLDDYYKVLGRKFASVADFESPKRIIKPKKTTKATPKVTETLRKTKSQQCFVNSLSENDLKFLKGLKISITDGQQ